jgi:hypothetical protein
VRGTSRAGHGRRLTFNVSQKQTFMDLTFSPTTAIEFAGNTFIDVPVILQFDNTPIVETIKEQTVQRTTQISIYNSDGIYVAKIVGPRLFLTADGKKSDLVLEHPPLMTVCRLGTQTLFEIRRPEAAAIAITAELFTPTGCFVRSQANKAASLFSSASKLLGTSIAGNTFKGGRVGIQFSSGGGIKIGG